MELVQAANSAASAHKSICSTNQATDYSRIAHSGLEELHVATCVTSFPHCLITIALTRRNADHYLNGIKMTNEANLPQDRLATIKMSQFKPLAAKYDVDDMETVIQQSPRQIETALRVQIDQVAKRDYKQVLLAGMGGSALPMDVVIDAFGDDIAVPVNIWRRYNLPRGFDESTLLIVSSFSGNTEETISALHQAMKLLEQTPDNASNTIVVCNGGELERLAREKGIPLVILPTDGEPEGFQPRCATGYFFTFFARILSDAGLLPDPTEALQSVPEFIDIMSGAIRSEAEEIALWFRDRIPVIYTEDGHRMSAARITKIKLNENSKRAAFFNAFPEVNHNEMIGFTNDSLGKFGILYIHDETSHERVLTRFETMRSVFESQGLEHVGFRFWAMPGETRIQRVFAAICFADWCSYSLALLDERNPTPVDLVEFFKKELSA